MKRFFLITFLISLCYNIYSQTVIDRIGPCGNLVVNPEVVPDKNKIPFALIPDSFIIKNKESNVLTVGIINPTLMINGIIIEDNDLIDKFRNSYDPSQIRFKWLTKEKSLKKNINCSEDGLLIVKTKKNYHLIL